MAKNAFVDVNKEKYLKALFRDIQKQTKMICFEDEAKNAKLIHDFVVGNPTNSDAVDKHGLLKRDGRFVIKARKSYKK
jgi:hypothetical protein